MTLTDGPEMKDDDKRESYVLLHQPVTLVCGRKLDSNPVAEVTWMNPQGEIVLTDGKYTAYNGPEVVHLNITSAVPADHGTWRCSVNVVSKYSTFDSEENISSRDYFRTLEVELNLFVVGEEYYVHYTTVSCRINITCTLPILSHFFHVHDSVPPGQPVDLSLTDMTPQCYQLRWSAPSNIGQPSLSHYEVTSISSNGEGVVYQTIDNIYKFSNAESGVSYEFSVMAVSVEGGVVGRSSPSESLHLQGSMLIN